MHPNETGGVVPPAVILPGPPGVAEQLRRLRRARRRRWLVLSLGAVVVAAAGIVVVPNHLRAQRNANESAAIAALKNISSAQAQCQAAGVIDRNGDGVGEYGFFGELSGAVAMRGKLARIDPPVLSAAYGAVRESRVHRGGYVFQMFLPDRGRQGVAEDASGGDSGDDNGVDARHAETLWCCYAWPERFGGTGQRAFFINHCGDVLTTNGWACAYDGDRVPCPFDAAFAASGARGLAAPVAANTVGRDGNTWVVVG